ncbi:hypothetical protein PR048_024438 [Dryococelus australis]|uniref:Uncharacterized protein n=1 Tax=Dryococelus australis TaxID=614101 RepID=A0ABQ9GNL6_9NEOP|nr:hypothetical protein PR048_024438 [Dryococelus australis]
MAARREELRQLEELVQERVKSIFLSSDIMEQLTLAFTAVTQAVLTELRESLDFNVEETKNSRAELKAKDSELQQVKRDLIIAKDDLEQYQRRNSLRNFGIAEDSQENTDVIALDTIHNKLNLPDISIRDTDRVGPKNRNNNRPRPIIVKFVSYRQRNEVFMAKRRLAKSSVTIREDITAERIKVLRAAVTKYGLKNVWTIDGRIIIKTDTRKISVTCMEELQRS